MVFCPVFNSNTPDLFRMLRSGPAHFLHHYWVISHFCVIVFGGSINAIYVKVHEAAAELEGVDLAWII